MKKAINQSTLSLILNGVSVLTLLFLVFSLLSYSKVNAKLKQDYDDRYELTYNANRFMNGSAYLTNEVRAFAATGMEEHYQNYWNEVNTLKNRDQGVSAMQEIGLTSDEQALIDDMYALSNFLVPLEEQAMEEAMNGEKEAALDYVYGVEYSTSIAEINSLKEQFLEDLDDRTLTQIQELEKMASFFDGAIIVSVLLVIIFQLTNMIFVKTKILRPVVKVRDQMGQISQGNLSADFDMVSNTSEIGMLVDSIHDTKRELKRYIKDIEYKLAQMAQGNMDLSIGNDYRGEFLPIQNAMREILEGLNSALSRIHTSAGMVSEESRRMALGAQTLSSGTVQQAAAVEELSASIKEIYDQVERTSKDSGDAEASSLEASGKLRVCVEKMEELKVAMEDISKSSHQIGGIIKTIEDISFQTNILALNAAVEAARAGEAGKGFAIVADEVQSLANKSAASAQDITDLIESSMKLVAHGTSLSGDTMEALAAVTTGAKRATELIGQMADSASQQSQSIKQLKLGMEQISEVVQTNAATAQESAASAQELQSQSEELRTAVSQFKLRGRR